MIILNGYTRFFPPFSAMMVLLACSIAWTQTFDVISIEGSAKVQRVQKKEWEKIAIGSQLHDNDIVESFFQTKCVLRFGKGNIVIVGSNSKVLVNIRDRQTASGAVLSDVNLTLFSGACFAKAISQAHIGVYTSNAVGETENGSFSTVVEAKTGETGFQVLGGNVKTRNIAQKEGIDLISGQTTMIFPGKEPTAPLYITYKHVSVLKHFFGEDYIQSEMDAAGIKPTEDKTSRSSTLLSDAMVAGQYGNTQDLTTYKIPFSLNKIYGAILADQEKNKRAYSPIGKPNSFEPDKLTLEQQSSFAIANGGVFPCIRVIPSYSMGPINVGLRLSLASNYTGTLSAYSLSSAAGFLDMIDHIVWEPSDAPYTVAAGPLHDLTMGQGAVVNGFNNNNPYALFQPMGLYASLSLSSFNSQMFIADLSQPFLGGLYLAYEPSVYHFGAGYFIDAHQFAKIVPKENNRFKLLPDSADIIADSMNASIYELDFSWDPIISEGLTVSIGADFAQKIKSSTTDGFVAAIPMLSFNWERMRVKAGLVSEYGRLIMGQFNSFYMANRWRIDSTNNGDTLFSQNTILSKKRSCKGLSLSFAVNPLKGAALEVSLRQNFSNKNSFAFQSDSSALAPGTDFSLTFSINDSLVKAMRYGEVYIRQEHTGLYPPRSSAFSSWEFSAGAEFMTRPLFYGIAFNGDVSFGFLDMNSNNMVDPGDAIFRFSIGFSRGF